VNITSRFERPVRRVPLPPGQLPPMTVLRPLAPGEAPPPPHVQAPPHAPHAPAIRIEHRRPLAGAAASAPAAASSSAAGVAVGAAASSITFRGFGSDVEKAADFLDAHLRESRCDNSTDPLRLRDDDVPAANVFGAVRAKALDLGVDVDHASTGTFVVRALGRRKLTVAVAQLREALLDAEDDYRQQRDAPPETWADAGAGDAGGQDGCSGVQCIDVGRDTPEWAAAAAALNSYGFGAEVTRVQRVQNERLWQDYAAQRQRVARRNGGDANELVVKHGTSGTDPMAVAGTDSGIDPRFCDRGMYGRGAYFAEEADYTHNGYAHALASGERQMFLCRIAAGRVDERASPDGSIRRPKNGHDSVRGPVRQSAGHPQMAYILYDCAQSYPEHLVTYRKA